MKMKDVTDLIKILDQYQLTEISWQEGENSLTLKKEIKTADKPVMLAPASLQADPLPPTQKQIEPEAKPETPNAHLHDIKSPMVGTFYIKPSPDNPPFVKIGDRVSKGQVICIIEAMKLMNEIESDVDGIVEKVCVKNSAPVEFDTTLFQIKKG